MDIKYNTGYRLALADFKKKFMDDIVNSIVNEPDKTYEQIAAEHLVSRQFVCDTAAARGVSRRALKTEQTTEGTDGQ